MLVVAPSIAEREPANETLASAAPLLNHNFDIRPEEAVELWANSTRIILPQEKDSRKNSSMVRHSADGQWVIRQGRHKGTLPSHDHTAEWASDQFGRLQELGMNVISRGMTPSPDGETIITITPWITDLAECAGHTFYSKIAPVLNRYFAEVATNSLMLADIRKIHQYSQLPDTGEVFLHDPDPYMCRAHSRTTQPIPL